MHGGAPIKVCSEPDADLLKKGILHLEKHLETARAFGLTPIVAINMFPNDPSQEVAMVEDAAAAFGARLARSEGFAKGGEGALALAEAVTDVVDATDPEPPKPKFIYELSDAPHEKMRKVARTVYGAKDVVLAPAARKSLERFEALGAAELPICMAKTQLSLTDDPSVHGRPRDFVITVRDVRLSAGAGFLVPLTGEMMTMPGLPKEPAARSIKLLPSGRIRGLMQND
jgi:formate--tetrahydrofolate ligase